MKGPVAACVGVALLLGSAGAASAHHTGVQYDFAKAITLKGVVKEFEAQNPHMQMALVVTDAKGTRTIDFEGMSANQMYRDGYRRGMVNVGDTITISYSPLKNGMEGGFFQTAVLADGRTFGKRMGGGGGPTPPATAVKKPGA